MSKNEKPSDLEIEIQSITTLEALERTIEDLQGNSLDSPVGFALVVAYADEESSVGVYLFPDTIEGKPKDSGELLALRLFQDGINRVVEDLIAYGPRPKSDFLELTHTAEELISKVSSNGKNKKPH